MIDCVRGRHLANARCFAFSGDVVDEEGKPLKDVTLVVSRHRQGSFGDYIRGSSQKSQGTEQIVNGSFNVIVLGAESVSVQLSKKDHYAEWFHLSKDGRFWTTKNYMPVPVGRVKVVLEKEYTRRWWDKRVAELEFNLDGSRTVADIASVDRNSDNRTASNVTVKEIREVTLPTVAMYVTVDIGEDGRFVVGDKAEKWGLDKMPARVRLTLAGENNGLILPTGWDRNRIRRPPETGYANDIVFTAKDLSERVGFYCRIGAKYGQGWIGVPEIKDDAQSVKIQITLHLPPD